jgi:malonyl-CoA O-methyltransferase
MKLVMRASKKNEKCFVEIAWGAEYTGRMTQSIVWLQDEIADRMLQKLDIVKLNVKAILLIPEFPGKYFSALKKRFPGARVDGLYEEDGPSIASMRTRLFQLWQRVSKGAYRGPLKNYLQTGTLALPDNSVDFIFCDLLLQDLSDPTHFLQECRRVLREGGLLTFSYLGPDTAKELRTLEAGSLKLQNLASPWDMHDMGDALLGARFSDPVMDMEYLHLDYDSDDLLLADINALKLLQMKPNHALEKGLLPQKLTLEVVYGHAWVIGKHLAKAQDSVAYIDINQIGRKTR